MHLPRRLALVATFGLAAPAVLAQTPDRLRIGYQKFGALTLVKARGTLERRLAPAGVTVVWTEFPAGPQLLEGLNVGSIDVGIVGEAPPIFAQAAGAPLVYIGFDPPNPAGEALLIQRDSRIEKVADLRGKRVALNRGSNVHYLLVRALQEAGLSVRDIQTPFLPPADGRAAFDRGSVDAWAIWDPFFAAAEEAVGARVLRDGVGIVKNHIFYMASRNAVTTHRRGIAAFLEELRDLESWVPANREQAVDVIANETRLDRAALVRVFTRLPFGVKPIDDEVIAEQQRIADTFFELQIIPRRITVAEAAPAAARSF